MPRPAALLVLFAALLSPVAATAQPDGFEPLFDGKSIDGWVQRGGKAEYRVEDGVIVGISVARTPNSFLCTPRDYADFELTLDVKVDPPLNSGIQIRSLYREEAYRPSLEWGSGKTWTGRIPARTVHGYQVEIDPSDRAWSGGIYDESRRGWLYDLAADEKADARAAFRPDDWNAYRIRCQGDRIQTWVNGVPVADLVDGVTAEGFIALQVHAVDSADDVGKQVRWKNLLIKEL